MRRWQTPSTQSQTQNDSLSWGILTEEWAKEHLGNSTWAHTECNYNGEQLLALCAEHGLWIANTFYEHRHSQRQTWYRWNDLNASSQIDFILT